MGVIVTKIYEECELANKLRGAVADLVKHVCGDFPPGVADKPTADPTGSILAEAFSGLLQTRRSQLETAKLLDRLAVALSVPNRVGPEEVALAPAQGLRGGERIFGDRGLR